MANILGFPLDILKTEQGPGYGGAVLAAVGCGEYQSVSEACEKLVEVADTVYPDKELSDLYEAKYRKFKKIYPALKDVFSDIRKDD